MTVATMRELTKHRQTKRASAVPVLIEQCRRVGLPIPVTELRFDIGGRRWRFDVAWPAVKIAVEIEGGAFMPGGSRHTRGAGFRKDRLKYGAAFAQGWTVLAVMPEQVTNGLAVGWLVDRFALVRESK